MDMTITTPALLFPAISLLLLAYTNRFLVLADVIRRLRRMEEEDSSDLIERQIKNLRRRLYLIKTMQTFGVLSFIICTVSMFSLLLKHQMLGGILFGASLVSLVISLIYSLREVSCSMNAINIELERMKEK